MKPWLFDNKFSKFMFSFISLPHNSIRIGSRLRTRSKVSTAKEEERSNTEALSCPPRLAPP